MNSFASSAFAVTAFSVSAFLFGAQEPPSQIYNTGYLKVSPHWRWRDREALSIPPTPAIVEIIEKKQAVSRQIDFDKIAVKALRAEIEETKGLIATQKAQNEQAALEAKALELEQMVKALALWEIEMAELDKALQVERMRQVALMILLLED